MYIYKSFLKRLLDITLSLLGLVILSPVFLLTTAALAVANRGSPFFFQERPGRNGSPFKIIKFKSMTDARDKQGELLPDKDRLTKAGAFVRKTSLDEIPQLINILKGDMSLVGPRPLLMQYLPFYTEREQKRHQVRPGVTGLAQVTQRNGLSWDEKLELDIQYVESLSFINDVKIIFKTVFKVLQRKDINVLPSQHGTLLSIARSNRYTLRPLIKEDLVYRVEWINDPRIHSTMNITTPISLDSTNIWFDKVKENKNRIDLVLTHNDIPVAMSGVVINDSNVAESYTFVNPDRKGEGIGSLAQFLRLVYAFDVFGAKEIVSIVDIDNIASRKAVEKFGFTLNEIRKNDLEKNGKLIDRCYYSCTKESFNRYLYGYRIKGHDVHYTHQRR